METAIFLLVALLILTIISITVPLAFVLEIIGWTWTGVPYVPLPNAALKKLSETLTLGKDSVLYDLGCGDGRVLFELAKHSDAQFIGVEKAPLPFLIALTRSVFSKKKNVKIIFGDIYQVPVGNATHVFTYLFSKVMDKLLPKMEQELKKGATLVSCDFRFKTKDATTEISLGTKPGAHTLYFYNF